MNFNLKKLTMNSSTLLSIRFSLFLRICLFLYEFPHTTLLELVYVEAIFLVK